MFHLLTRCPRLSSLRVGASAALQRPEIDGALPQNCSVWGRFSRVVPSPVSFRLARPRPRWRADLPIGQTNVQAARAQTDQALGAMPAQLSVSGNTTANDRKYQTRNSPVPPAKDSYNSNAAQVSVTQPIWRYANIVGWQQAEAVAAQAEHQLAGAEQELFARLVTAWFDLLAARDAVAFYPPATGGPASPVGNRPPGRNSVPTAFRRWSMPKPSSIKRFPTR